MKSARLPHLAVLLPIACALAPAAAGQSERQLASDMEFARQLASRYAYVDLSEEIISKIEARQLTGKDAEALGLLKCDVYAAGAKGERMAEMRLELYDKAIEAYRDYLRENEYSDFVPTAQRNYVDLVNAYGRILEIQLDEYFGEELATLREKIKTVVEDALDLTSALIDETSGASTKTEKNERWRLMLNRGQMLLTIANVSEDGSFFYTRAEQTLEDLALEAGETSGPGLNAYLLLARVKLAQGSAREAADFSQFVVDVAMPTTDETRDQYGWKDATFEDKLPRWKLGEVATSVVVGSFTELGDSQVAADYALHFYNTWKSEGFDISPLGHLALLEVARALLESGGYVGGRLTSGDLEWFETQEEMNGAGYQGTRNARSALDLALSVAQTVNDENKGNTLQVRAQKVISEIIGRPGVKVSPDILFEAAQGDYFNDDFPQALDSFKGIMRQLDTRDEATQQEYAPKVLFHIGSSLAKMDRNLEAAMAFREAATTWAGDPEYQEKVCTGFYRSIGLAKTASGNDPLLENLYLEAENMLRSVGTASKGQISFRQAERAYGAKDYTEARAKFLEVEEGDDLYEKALSKAALCLYKVKDTAGATAEFSRYLEQYVTDPRTKPVDAKKRSVREEAMAVATFYLGRMSFSAGDYPVVIERLSDYAEAFPDQTDYAPNALYMVVVSHLGNGDIEDAKGVVTHMKEVFGNHKMTGSSAGQVFNALSAEEEKARKSGDEVTADAFKVQMAEYMHLSNELAPEPKYDNLRKESSLWVDLGRWVEAQAVLEQIVAGFEGDSEIDLGKHVLPDLGLALLEQQRVPDAFRVLDPLVPREENARPSSKLITRWCRAVCGWVTGDGNTITEVPGVGGAENLELACSFLRKLTEAEGAKEKYTCPWYHLKFDTAYGYYQWGLVDSVQTRNASVLIENLRNILGQTRLDDIAEKCGDDVLQKRFLWLQGKLN
jgi:tetratricopeptide (TPR) repeat protein